MIRHRGDTRRVRRSDWATLSNINPNIRRRAERQHPGTRSAASAIFTHEAPPGNRKSRGRGGEGPPGRRARSTRRRPRGPAASFHLGFDLTDRRREEEEEDDAPRCGAERSLGGHFGGLKVSHTRGRLFRNPRKKMR
ncbi:hypothetical protein EYF80_059239 [Liparis tanakae]|uniref:Uncharacterized protein n=1 Tax=Liparis tanakae TaxID=230148 RepID=A0A4Z2EPS6_9TELE|nr:hypothetical protein EYF80_059239 [Liparis tanakae]